MAAKRGLKVVEAPAVEPTALMGKVGRAAASSRADLLRALRDRIAGDIDAGVPARDLASLSRRLLDISKELDDLEGAADDVVSAAASTPDEAWSG